MKKLFLLSALVLLSSVLAHAQVTFDNLLLSPYQTRIDVVTKNGQLYLHLLHRDPSARLATQPRILFQMGDNSVLDLEGTLTRSERILTSSKVQGGVTEMTYLFECEAIFPITHAQMETFRHGVLKVRQCTVPDFQERVWKKDKIGAGLYKLYQEAGEDSFKKGF